MSITQVRRLPRNQKLQIMEAIWEELRSRADGVPVPDCHKQLLDERRKAVDEGREKVMDWDKVKNTLRKRQA